MKLTFTEYFTQDSNHLNSIRSQGKHSFFALVLHSYEFINLLIKLYEIMNNNKIIYEIIVITNE